MSKITLKNMEFHAYHGCLEHEKSIGNSFMVTLSITLDTSIAEQSDELTDTLNYQQVYDTVREVMERPVNLIEHLSNRITNAIMESFPTIQELHLTLSKLHPPLGAKVESVSIEMERKRG